MRKVRRPERGDRHRPREGKQLRAVLARRGKREGGPWKSQVCPSQAEGDILFTHLFAGGEKRILRRGGHQPDSIAPVRDAITALARREGKKRGGGK